MMLRGWPSGGVEPVIPGTQQVRREGLEGTWRVINDDRIGWRGQLESGDSWGQGEWAQKTVQDT